MLVERALLVMLKEYGIKRLRNTYWKIQNNELWMKKNALLRAKRDSSLKICKMLLSNLHKKIGKILKILKEIDEACGIYNITATSY